MIHRDSRSAMVCFSYDINVSYRELVGFWYDFCRVIALRFNKILVRFVRMLVGFQEDLFDSNQVLLRGFQQDSNMILS